MVELFRPSLAPISSYLEVDCADFRASEIYGVVSARDHRWARIDGECVMCCMCFGESDRFCLFSPFYPIHLSIERFGESDCFCYRALWSFSNFSSHSCMSLNFEHGPR